MAPKSIHPIAVELSCACLLSTLHYGALVLVVSMCCNQILKRPWTVPLNGIASALLRIAAGFSSGLLEFSDNDRLPATGAGDSGRLVSKSKQSTTTTATTAPIVMMSCAWVKHEQTINATTGWKDERGGNSVIWRLVYLCLCVENCSAICCKPRGISVFGASTSTATEPVARLWLSHKQKKTVFIGIRK